MNALSLTVRKLWAILKFFKSRSNVTVKFTCTEFMVPLERPCHKALTLLVLYVTCNDISVIYVTAQMCRRTEEVVSTVGLPTP